MSRLRTLSIMAGTVAMLVLSAAPATAWWKSTLKPPQSQGNIIVIASGEFTYEGAKVTCPKEEIKAQYHIQAKGPIKLQQAHVTEGPHLNIQVKNWGKCKSEVGASKLEVEVKECALQLVQQKESFTATGGVVTPCVIKLGALCEIQVPAGMEKQAGSNNGQNVGLNSISLSNVGENQFDKANVEGVLAYSVGKNALCPLAHSTNTATLKGLEFEAVGVNAI